MSTTISSGVQSPVFGQEIMVAQISLKKGKEVDAEKVAKEIATKLDTVEKNHSTVVTNMIKKATTNQPKQIEILDKLAVLLRQKDYEEDSISAVITDVKTRLKIVDSKKSAPVSVLPEQKIEVKPAPTQKPAATILCGNKTGAMGNDSPEFMIEVKVDNLPKGTTTLSGHVTTNQEWGFGAAPTGGKTSGTFDFTGYVHPNNFYINNRFSIKTHGGEGIRIPANENRFIEFIPGNLKKCE